MSMYVIVISMTTCGSVFRVAGPPWYGSPRPAPRLPIHMLFAALRSPNSCVLHTTHHKPVLYVLHIQYTDITHYIPFASICTLHSIHYYYNLLYNTINICIYV